MDRSLPHLRNRASTSQREIQHPARSPAANPGFPPVGALQEINERCLEAMTAVARADTAPPFPMSIHVRELLRSSSTEMRRLAASRRFVLIDMGFRDTQWWLSQLGQTNRSSRCSTWGSSFARREGTALARSILMLAWHGANSDPESTRIAFGMTAEVLHLIGHAQLRDLDRIAERHYRCVRPRWVDRPWVWRALLEAAREGSAEALLAVDLHGLQLMTGDFLPLARRRTAPRL